MAESLNMPKGLGSSGRRLWKDVTEDLDLDVHEELTLASACRTADRLESIAEELKGQPQTITSPKTGELMIHPLLVEHRNQAQSYIRLIASLRLPTGLTADGELERPQRRGAARGSYGIRGVV